MNFTSPRPIDSFPYINFPINDINRNTLPPISIPNNKSIVIATFENPYKNAITIPTSKIVKLSLLGITLYLQSIINADKSIGTNNIYLINSKLPIK